MPGRGLWRCSIEHLQRPPALTLSRGSARELITIAFGSERRAPPRPSSPPARRQSARASPLWPPRTHRVGLSHASAQRLALGAPLDYGSDTGVSGDLRIALRMSLSAEFVRYGRRSERCRVVDYGGMCVDRVRTWLREHLNACIGMSYAGMVRPDRARWFVLYIQSCGTRRGRARSSH